MKIIFVSHFVFLILILFSSVVEGQSAQDDPVIKLDRYQENRPQEKVYLHLNKQTFAQGETIWFKAYLTDAFTLKPGELSKVLYVDLVDAQNNLAYTRTIQLIDGTGKGDILIDDSLIRGDYFIRAYTEYMLNYDLALLFVTPIKIISNPEVSKEDKSKTIGFDVKFFPEGGNMVNGLVNTIGFKAVDASSRGIELSGTIHTRDGTQITAFKSVHLGMGQFKLIPSSGEVYFARAIYMGRTIEFPLPDVKENGAIIQITPTTKKLTLKVLTRDYTLADHYLLCIQEGKSFNILKPDPTNQYFFSLFDTQGLSNGVVYFTLFDGANRPIAERIAFVFNPNQMPAAEIQRPEGIGTREKIDLKLNLATKQSAKASVSIVQSSLFNAESTNICNYLLLTSDLRGTIESPGYYFEGFNEDKAKHLDNLMLTQGWRRFVWSDILQDTLPPIHHFLEQSMKLKGQLFKYINPDKSQPGEVSFTILENPLFNAVVQTDSEGKFEFGGLDFSDTATIILQAKKIGKKSNKNGKSEKNDAYLITTENRNYPDLSKNILPLEVSTDKSEEVGNLMEKIKEVELAFGENVTVLEAIEIVQKKDPYDNPIDKQAGAFYKNPSYRIILDSLSFDPRNISVDVFGLLQSLQIPNFDPITMQSRGGGTTIMGDSRVAVFYQGQKMDADFIGSRGRPGSLSPQDIGAIDYFTGPNAAKFGVLGAQGVLVIHPRTNFPTSLTNVSGISTIYFPGYYQAREFYSPSYELENSSKPDFRSTLYWNPEIDFDQEGNASISFYASDESGTYTIDLQGLTHDGKPFTISTTLKVHK